VRVLRFLLAFAMEAGSGNKLLVQGPLTPNDGNGFRFKIPPGITTITRGLLNGFGVNSGTIPYITAITIPDSMDEIDDYTFSDFPSLAEVNIPYSVEGIGTGGFIGCASLVAVVVPGSVTVVGSAAFAYCTALEKVTLPNASLIKLVDNAFLNCPALRAVEYGRVADLAAPNRFPALNGVARTATVEHPLGDGDSCVVQRTWPASTTEIEPEVVNDYGEVEKSAMYAGTEPGPVTKVVDATGIVSPIPLQDLGGNEYPVHGCWATTADFKVLAVAQHPKALGAPASWAVLPPNADAPVDTLDLAEVALMLALGDLSLKEPWLLVWNSDKASNVK
jgi:hypothetical protein